jgi:hypothetical protein
MSYKHNIIQKKEEDVKILTISGLVGSSKHLKSIYNKLGSKKVLILYVNFIKELFYKKDLFKISDNTIIQLVQIFDYSGHEYNHNIPFGFKTICAFRIIGDGDEFCHLKKTKWWRDSIDDLTEVIYIDKVKYPDIYHIVNSNLNITKVNLKK